MNPGAWRYIRLVVCCAALVSAAASLSSKAPVRQWSTGAMANPTSPAISGAAQRIEIDPLTGQVLEADASAPRDAAAPIQRAAIRTAPATNALPRDGDEVHLADGTVGVRVARRFYHTISVCRQADGSFSSDCPAAKP
jgi:hypothetical protein